MRKLTALSLVTVALLGVAAPAFATPYPVNTTNPAADRASFDDDYIVAALKDRGVNAVAAYAAGKDTVRVVVVNKDGTQSFAYFDQDSLTQITTGVAN